MSTHRADQAEGIGPKKALFMVVTWPRKVTVAPLGRSFEVAVDQFWMSSATPPRSRPWVVA